MSGGGSEIEQQLSESAAALYQHVVMRGRLDLVAVSRDLTLDPASAAEACECLLRLRLLTQSADGLLTPVHPDLGLKMLNEPLVDAIRDRERAIETNVKHLSRISYLLAHSGPPSTDTHGIRVVTGAEEVRRELDAAILRCTNDFVTMQPGGPGSHTELREMSKLKSGVSLRLMYQHTARANLGMRSYVAEVAKHGGSVRTTSAGFERMFIFDRKIAFIPHEPADSVSGAAIVSHPSVVSFLYRGFERLWTSAMPFEYNDAQYDEVSVDIKITLLRLMASGLKDEAIANRLGMATRTCRRHMSAIMAELDATSRFQAGVKIAQLGILSDHDSAPVSNHRADAHPAW
jgi:DNA-binding CsgD family transcriptional regulator